MGGKTKGNSYEREICTLLSLWWTDGKRDDIFWRSASSGGRATSRFRRSNKKTAGSHGDITAICPSGNSLLRFACIEIKRGYSRATIQDVLDAKRKNPSIFEGWVKQASESAVDAESFSWMIISRRDQRCSMAWMPIGAMKKLQALDAFASTPVPNVVIDAYFDGRRVKIIGMPLEEWFFHVRPKHIKRALADYENQTKRTPS